MQPRSRSIRTVVGYLLRIIDEELTVKDVLYRENMTLYPTFDDAFDKAESYAQDLAVEPGAIVIHPLHNVDSEKVCERDGSVLLFEVEFEHENKQVMAFAVYAP